MAKAVWRFREEDNQLSVDFKIEGTKGEILPPPQELDSLITSYRSTKSGIKKRFLAWRHGYSIKRGEITNPPLTTPQKMTKTPDGKTIFHIDYLLLGGPYDADLFFDKKTNELSFAMVSGSFYIRPSQISTYKL